MSLTVGYTLYVYLYLHLCILRLTVLMLFFSAPRNSTTRLLAYYKCLLLLLILFYGGGIRGQFLCALYKLLTFEMIGHIEQCRS